MMVIVIGMKQMIIERNRKEKREKRKKRMIIKRNKKEKRKKKTEKKKMKRALQNSLHHSPFVSRQIWNAFVFVFHFVRKVMKTKTVKRENYFFV